MILEEDKTDLRKTIRNLYPEREVMSRFSVKNPNARFSMHPSTMRETINTLRIVGKQDNTKDKSKKQKGDVNGQVKAYESIINKAISDHILTNQNINDLFSKAQLMEQETKDQEDIYDRQ